MGVLVVSWNPEHDMHLPLHCCLPSCLAAIPSNGWHVQSLTCGHVDDQGLCTTLLYCATVHHVQVHDELLFEVREGHVAAAASLVQRAMEDAAAVWALKVSLPVKVSVGSSWGQLQEYMGTEG